MADVSHTAVWGRLFDLFDPGKDSPWLQLLSGALEPLAYILKERLQFFVGMMHIRPDDVKAVGAIGTMGACAQDGEGLGW